MSKRAAVNTVPEGLIWVCEKGHVDDHHLDYGGVCLTCLGTGVGEYGEAPDPPCSACDGSGRATNDLCSRCGGKCTLFRSVEHLAREYVERLRVNVGLLVENKQLKRKLEEAQ